MHYPILNAIPLSVCSFLMSNGISAVFTGKSATVDMEDTAGTMGTPQALPGEGGKLMGLENDAMLSYLEDNRRFADLFNQLYFNG